jgi:hypothetical protein
MLYSEFQGVAAKLRVDERRTRFEAVSGIDGGSIERQKDGTSVWTSFPSPACLRATHRQAGRGAWMPRIKFKPGNGPKRGKAIVAHEFCSGSGIRNVELNPQYIYVASKLVVVKNELCFMRRIGETLGRDGE